MSSEPGGGSSRDSEPDQANAWAVPSEATLEVIAQSQGLVSTPERMRLILRHYKALWPWLSRLRRVQLDYIDPIEPSDVFDWIERWPPGGKIEVSDGDR